MKRRPLGTRSKLKSLQFLSSLKRKSPNDSGKGPELDQTLKMIACCEMVSSYYVPVYILNIKTVLFEVRSLKKANEKFIFL